MICRQKAEIFIAILLIWIYAFLCNFNAIDWKIFDLSFYYDCTISIKSYRWPSLATISIDMNNVENNFTPTMLIGVDQASDNHHYHNNPIVVDRLVQNSAGPLIEILLPCSVIIINQALVDREGSLYYYIPLTPRVSLPPLPQSAV